MQKKQKLENENSKLTEAECNAIKCEIKHYENPRSAAIEALKIVQKKRGWIQDWAIYAIADILNVPASDVEGLATFYSQIFRQPVGRHVIRYCDSIVCYIMGFQNIQAAIEKKLNLKPGQTTVDGRFTLLPTCCLGKCDMGPSIMINEETHVNLTPEAISDLLECYK